MWAGFLLLPDVMVDRERPIQMCHVTHVPEKFVRYRSSV
jgi:hypothetical protein